MITNEQRERKLELLCKKLAWRLKISKSLKASLAKGKKAK